MIFPQFGGHLHLQLRELLPQLVGVARESEHVRGRSSLLIPRPSL